MNKFKIALAVLGFTLSLNVLSSPKIEYMDIKKLGTIQSKNDKEVLKSGELYKLRMSMNYGSKLVEFPIMVLKDVTKKESQITKVYIEHDFEEMLKDADIKQSEVISLIKKDLLNQLK